MKYAVTVLILTLTLPNPCFGHTVSDPHLEPTVLETNGWEGYHLDIEQFSQSSPSFRLNSDLAPLIEDLRPASRSLRTMDAGLPCDTRSVPEDMVSMISFLWAEMFGGVDVVAEAKELAWQLRSRRSRSRTVRVKGEDRRSKWNFVIACRVDDQMELAARFKSRGHLFGEGSMALQVKAAEPRTNEVGLIMSYVDGGLSLKPDSVSLADAAEVKLVVKF